MDKYEKQIDKLNQKFSAMWTILIMFLLFGWASNAQQVVKVDGDNAYYEITEHKVKFYYKYTLEDDIDEIEYNYGFGALVPPTILSADVSTEGEYVVLKRIKAIQQSGYRLAIRFEDLFRKPLNRKGKIKKHLLRWTNMLITAIKQY